MRWAARYNSCLKTPYCRHPVARNNYTDNQPPCLCRSHYSDMVNTPYTHQSLFHNFYPCILVHIYTQNLQPCQYMWHHFDRVFVLDTRLYQFHISAPYNQGRIHSYNSWCDPDTSIHAGTYCWHSHLCLFHSLHLKEVYEFYHSAEYEWDITQLFSKWIWFKFSTLKTSLKHLCFKMPISELLHCST